MRLSCEGSRGAAFIPVSLDGLHGTGLSLCLVVERTCKIASVVEHGVGGPGRFQVCLSGLYYVHSLIDGLLVKVQMRPQEVSIRP